ncbi:hypothetical protein QBC39DRAFT_151972 [Podospora conica]|nr:hypothetical protein QBC39DRAFT_151972 [Schizothecium conicum]
MGRRGTQCLSGFLGQAAAPAANVSGGGSRSTCRMVNTTALGDWRSARCSDCVVMNARRSLAVRDTRARARRRGQGRMDDGRGYTGRRNPRCGQEKSRADVDCPSRPNQSQTAWSDPISPCRAAGREVRRWATRKNQRVVVGPSFVGLSTGGTLCRVHVCRRGERMEGWRAGSWAREEEEVVEVWFIKKRVRGSETREEVGCGR